MAIDLREVSECDLATASKLIASVFNRPCRCDDAERLRWVLFANPDAHSEIPKGWVLTSNGKMVGFLANVLRRMSFFGNDHLVAFTSNYVVAPSHRFHGLSLMRAFFDQEHVKYLACSSGSENSIQILKRLGAHEIVGAGEAAAFVFRCTPVVSYLLQKRGYRNRCVHTASAGLLKLANWVRWWRSQEPQQEAGLSVERASRFHDEVHEFYKRHLWRDRVTSHRAAATLNWLFVDGQIDRPQTKIRNVYRSDRFCGYAVTQDRVLGNPRVTYRQVRDILCEENDWMSFDALIRQLLSESAREGIDCLEFQSIPSALINRMASYGAWRRELSENPFLLYSRGDAHLPLARQPGSWYLVPSDGDCGGW